MLHNNEILSCLNDLIETCKDEEKGFREAASRVGKDGKPVLRTMLNLFAQQRAWFMAELQTEVLRRGGEPAKSGHISATIRRGWLDLKSSLAAGPDYDDENDYEFSILQSCEAGEKAAMENYEDALKKNLPADLMAIVEQQYFELRQGRERMHLLAAEYHPVA